jgi:hypothetical protein
MQFFNRIAHSREIFSDSLNNEQPFFRRFNLLFPPINRGEPGKDIDASGQAQLYESLSDIFCILL